MNSVNKEKIWKTVKDISNDLRVLSLDIHANPELNFEERHAHDTLTKFLEDRGFAVERGAFGVETAFVARHGNGDPTIAVLCEYDALPEIGHACGHNLIAASGVAAGISLKESINEIGGTILVLGTPAEEGGGGKIKMIDRGAFDSVDAALMVHPSPGSNAWPAIMALHELEVEFFGKNAHAAAYPWEGVNALDALVLSYNGISVLRQQLKPDTRVHGIITNGGAKPNIIPDYTSADFYLRARDNKNLANLKDRVLDCFTGAAQSTGCRINHQWVGDPYYNMATNDLIAEAYVENMKILGKHLPEKGVGSTAGSTDMGNVSHVVPSIHPMFSIETAGGNHTPEFTAAAATPAAHDSMLEAAAAMAMTAHDLFTDSERLQNVRKEFQKQESA